MHEPTTWPTLNPVSYTHLDVYKRQVLYPVEIFVHDVLTHKFIAVIRDEQIRYKINVPKKFFTSVSRHTTCLFRETDGSSAFLVTPNTLFVTKKG